MYSRQTLQIDKRCYMSGSHVSKQDILFCTLLLSITCEKSFKDKLNPLQLFTFTKVIRCSRLPLSLGYFKFSCVSSIVY